MVASSFFPGCFCQQSFLVLGKAGSMIAAHNQKLHNSCKSGETKCFLARKGMSTQADGCRCSTSPVWKLCLIHSASWKGLTSYELGYLMSTNTRSFCQKKPHQSTQWTENYIHLSVLFHSPFVLPNCAVIPLQLLLFSWTCNKIFYSEFSLLFDAFYFTKSIGRSSSHSSEKQAGTYLRYFKPQCTRLSNSLCNLNTEMVKTRHQADGDPVSDLFKSDKKNIKVKT